MNATRKKWGGVLLGALLWALPAAAAQAQGDRCEADCATKTAEPMQTCVRACPQPGNGKDLKSTSAYHSCAARCSAKFQERFKTCKKKCPEKKPLKK